MPVKAQQPAAQSVVASGTYERFRRVKVVVTAPLDMANKAVQITDASHALAAGTLAAGDGKASAALILPMPPRGTSYGPLQVSVDGRQSATLDLPNADSARMEAFQSAAFNFRPAVFAGDRFPAGDFDQPNLVEDLIGPYTLATAYYDNDYNVVTAPTRPGRYGAVVEIRAEDGKIYRRYVTLFHQPQEVDWRSIEMPFTLQLPAGLGIDPTVAKEQSGTIDGALKRLFVNGMSGESGMAMLLSGLYTTTPGTPATERNSAQSNNQRWWYGLKHRLGLAGYRYLISVPPRYDADASKRWPLMVFLHGSGERGDDLEKVRTHGPPKLIAQGRTLPFIVVSPQCPDGDWWLPEEVIDLIDEVSAKYRVDADRVYLTGLSMGGYGTWATAIDYPDRFAAIAPVCGIGDPADVARIKHLPVWAFQGGKDPVVSPEGHRKTVEVLKAAGGDVQFTVYPDAGHDSWTQTYNNEELYAWLLQHRRAARP